jgi:hypothetical protein
MSSKATPMPLPREPNGIIQHEYIRCPPSSLVEAGSSAVRNQAALPVGTISRTRQNPQNDAVEAAQGNLDTKTRMFISERFV